MAGRKYHATAREIKAVIEMVMHEASDALTLKINEEVDTVIGFFDMPP